MTVTEFSLYTVILLDLQLPVKPACVLSRVLCVRGDTCRDTPGPHRQGPVRGRPRPLSLLKLVALRTLHRQADSNRLAGDRFNNELIRSTSSGVSSNRVMSWRYGQESEHKTYRGKGKTVARRLTANRYQEPNPFVGHEQ